MNLASRFELTRFPGGPGGLEHLIALGFRNAPFDELLAFASPFVI